MSKYTIKDSVANRENKDVSPILELAIQDAKEFNELKKQQEEGKKYGYGAKKLPSIVPQEMCELAEGFKPRAVQEMMFKGFATSYRAGSRRILIQAPTGAGKTIWAALLFRAMLSKNPNQRLVFIVPRLNLLQQTRSVLAEFMGLPISVIQANNPDLDFRHQVYVATIQTLGKRCKTHPDTFGKIEFGVMVIDEAHIQFSDREDVKASLVCGLSATPYSKGLAPFFEELVKTISPSELVKSGVITPIKVDWAVPQIDIDSLKVGSTGEYTEESENEAVGQIIGDIVGSYKANKEIQGLPFIGFTRTIAQAESLCEEFEAEGYKVAVVHSKLSNDDNQAILDTFKAGLLDGVMSVIKLIEGFDYPACSVLIMAVAFAPNKKQPHQPNALTKYVQMIGRVRRAFKDKVISYIHDHGLNFVRFGHPDDYDKDFLTLLSKKEKVKDDNPIDVELRKKRKCSNCGEPVYGITCAKCGHENKATSKMVEAVRLETLAGSMTNMIDSELMNVKTSQKPVECMEDIYSGCVYEFNQINRRRADRDLRPMKKGWVYHKFLEIAGMKPNFKYPEAPVESQTVNNYIRYERIKYFKAKQKS